ncbi:patatin-like phospholipase family protein [Glycomyces endophyticus]|uniref:Patatin-like phospholipase family protein n=1 Tax=Glycomyces endophyticus TaxID=480996 RepID=A0ABP4U199_9ACTN
MNESSPLHAVPAASGPPLDATARVPSGTRALVLGGGGSAGNAWLIGVVAGLAEAGLDVTGADLVVGTSAGATAATQITGANPADLLTATLAPPPPRPGPAADRIAAAVAAHMDRMRRLIAAATGPDDLRRALAAAAMDLDAGADGTRSAQWRATVAARLPAPDWPDRAVLLTAVDARTGEPVVLDRRSGVDLADAVAASCSSGPPHRVGGHRFIDGGFRRNDNADLAAGCERVLVLSPLGGTTLTPPAWGMHLAAQTDELRAAGSRVATVLPDDDARAAFGDSLMDPAARPPSARAGHRQGLALAEHLAELWR